MSEFTVRKFEADRDYDLICSWWKAAQMAAPEKEMVPEESSFVVVCRDQPIAMATVIETNTKVAWVENFICDPNFDRALRREYCSAAFQVIEEHAKKTGHTRLFCMSSHPKTTNRYFDFGFKPTLYEVTTMTKEIN